MSRGQEIGDEGEEELLRGLGLASKLVREYVRIGGSLTICPERAFEYSTPPSVTLEAERDL